MAVREAVNPIPTVQVGVHWLFPSGGLRIPIMAVTPLGSVEAIENVTGSAEPMISVATI